MAHPARLPAGIHEQQLVSAAQAVGMALAGDYFEAYVGQVRDCLCGSDLHMLVLEAYVSQVRGCSGLCTCSTCLRIHDTAAGHPRTLLTSK